GRNVVEFGEIHSQEEKVRDFFVGGDCTCRVVVTLADGMVVSNSYGYFCYGMGCGRVDVVVTKDRRIEIVDRLNRETVETERWLRATRLPAVHLNAPVTMEDFAKYMNEASRDYDDPRRQPDERGMEFTCSDLVKKRAFPVQTDPRGTPIPCIQASDVSFWEVLEQACRLTDCHINVFGRTIFIWPNAEKGVSVNDISN
nr:hypothetical protein [Kiritimatiellia bacterium]